MNLRKVSSFAIVVLALTSFVFRANASNELTPRLNLQMIPNQVRQQHLVLNQNNFVLDAMVFPMLAAYPASATPEANLPNEGDLFIVPSDAEGSWNGQTDNLAVYQNASWRFIQPATGFVVLEPIEYVPLVNVYKRNQLIYLGEAEGWSDDVTALYRKLYIGDYDDTDVLSYLPTLSMVWNPSEDSLGPILIRHADTGQTLFNMSGQFQRIITPYSIDSAGWVDCVTGYRISGVEGFSGIVPSDSKPIVSGGLIVAVTDGEGASVPDPLSVGTLLATHLQVTEATLESATMTTAVIGDGSALFGAELTVNGNAAIETVNGPTITFSRSDTNVGEGEILGDISFYSDDTSVGFAGVRALIRAVNTGSSGGQTNIDFYNSSGPASNLARTLRLDHTGNGIFENAVVVGGGSAANGAVLTANGKIHASTISLGTSLGKLYLYESGLNTYGLGISAQETRLFSADSPGDRVSIGTMSSSDGVTFSEYFRVESDNQTVVGGGAAQDGYALTVNGDVYSATNSSEVYLDRSRAPDTRKISALDKIRKFKVRGIVNNGIFQIDKDALPSELVITSTKTVKDAVVLDKTTGEILSPAIRISKNTTVASEVLAAADLPLPEGKTNDDLTVETTEYEIEVKGRDIGMNVSLNTLGVQELDFRELAHYEEIIKRIEKIEINVSEFENSATESR